MAGDITVLNTSLLRKESPRKHLYKVILRLVNGKHGVYMEYMAIKEVNKSSFVFCTSVNMDQITFRSAYGLILLCIMQFGTGLSHDSMLPCTYWPLYRNAWQGDLQL